MKDRFTLAGRAALVTGASAGIGLHIARLFAGAGAAVALAARRVDKVVAEAESLRSKGHRAAGVFLDVARPQTIAKCMDAAEGALDAPIDILFNNAGVILSKAFLEQSEEEIDRVLDTNLKGALLTAQEAARRMASRQGGAIVNVSSTAGLRPGGFLSSYCASKAALIHLTKVMALELAHKGVRVNALCPGNIVTDMHESLASSGFTEALLKRIPQRRFGSPEDLDGAALLLASDAGRYMTGAAVAVDGGQLVNSI